MLGSYYEAHTLDPIKALGAVSDQASLAHEAIREFLMGPIGRFAPWATQTLNGWQVIVYPEYNYSIFPINSNTLRAAEDAAMGNPVGMIGILFRQPMPMNAVDELFAAGPYEAARGEVVYRLDDMKEVPTAQFLYLGKLGDEGKHDGYGTYEAMEAAVMKAGGTLVFAMPTERTGAERAVADGTLESAVAATMGQEVPVSPTDPGTAPIAPESPAQYAPELAPEPPDTYLAPQTSGGGAAGLVVGFMGLAVGGLVGYYAVRKRP